MAACPAGEPLVPKPGPAFPEENTKVGAGLVAYEYTPPLGTEFERTTPGIYAFGETGLDSIHVPEDEQDD